MLAPLNWNYMLQTSVIWNPNSGQADAAATVRQLMENEPAIDVRETKSAEEARTLAAESAADSDTLVIAAGGDGTVNSVLNGVLSAAKSPRMAVLPIGTANDFAFTLGMPTDIGLAWAAIQLCKFRALDIAELETAHERRCFANVAAGGNSDRVTQNLTDEIKETWGSFCYLRSAVEVVTDLATFNATVQFDDDPAETISLWNVVVANGRTNAGRLMIAPMASVEDGLLDIILIRDGGTFDLVGITAQLAVGDYLDSDLVVHRQVRSFAIQSNPEMRFSIDGEPIDDQPVIFRARSGTVQMAVGPDYQVDTNSG